MVVAQLQGWKKHPANPKTMSLKSLLVGPHKVAGSPRSQVKIRAGSVNGSGAIRYTERNIDTKMKDSLHVGLVDEGVSNPTSKTR